MNSYGYQSFGCLFQLLRLLVLGVQVLVHRLFRHHLKQPKK